jgi:hypothetical protein
MLGRWWNLWPNIRHSSESWNLLSFRRIQGNEIPAFAGMTVLEATR